jgi:hypothetical protein
MNKLYVLLPALLTLGISACATGPAEPESLADKLKARNYIFGEPVERIRNHRINGWNRIDDRHVIIKAGVSDDYLLVLRNPCMNLSSAMELAFTSTAGALTEFDKLMVSGPGGYVDRCYIHEMYKINRIEMADSKR